MYRIDRTFDAANLRAGFEMERVVFHLVADKISK